MVARVTRVCAADATGIYWLGKRTSRRPTPRRPGHEPPTGEGSDKTATGDAVGCAVDESGARSRSRGRPGQARTSQSVAGALSTWNRYVVGPVGVTVRRTTGRMTKVGHTADPEAP